MLPHPWHSAAPTNSSAGNPYTVSVPSGSNYFFFGILDQNNDGQIDAGDVSNTDSNSNSVTISGNLTGENETLPDVNSMATAQTQYNQNLYWNGTSSGTSISYNINFDVRGANKLPVAVQLVSASNPNVIIPVDISNLGTVRRIQNMADKGHQEFLGATGSAPKPGPVSAWLCGVQSGRQGHGGGQDCRRRVWHPLSTDPHLRPAYSAAR